jgi:hypothetical protein
MVNSVSEKKEKRKIRQRKEGEKRKQIASPQNAPAMKLGRVALQSEASLFDVC